jgi:hypothetical protein
MWRSLGAYDTGAGAETGFEWRRGEGGYRRSLLRRRHRADAPALVSRANPRLVRAAAGGLGEAMGGGCGSRPSRVFARAFARSVRDASTGAARPGRSIQRGPEPIKTCRNGSGGSSSRWCVCHRSLPDQVVAKYTGRRQASASARRDGMLPKHLPAAHLLSMLAIGSVRPSLRRANDPVTGPAGKARRHRRAFFREGTSSRGRPRHGSKAPRGPEPIKEPIKTCRDGAGGIDAKMGRMGDGTAMPPAHGLQPRHRGRRTPHLLTQGTGRACRAAGAHPPTCREDGLGTVPDDAHAPWHWRCISKARRATRSSAPGRKLNPRRRDCPLASWRLTPPVVSRISCAARLDRERGKSPSRPR